MPDDYDRHFDRHWFRDQLRQRDRTIANLRREIDEANRIVPLIGKQDVGRSLASEAQVVTNLHKAGKSLANRRRTAQAH